MKTILRIAFCLAALVPLRALHADDDASGIKVDVVDDLTSDGHGFHHPDRAHPTYYYPIVKGDVNGGAVISGEAPPPPTNDVLQMIAKALYDQGYQVANKAHPPSIILMFWWGIKAPITLNSSSNGVALPARTKQEAYTVNKLLNADEMKEIVLGTKYASGLGDTEEDTMSMRLQWQRAEWTVPRYYLMLSSMDFNKAMTKDAKGHPNIVVLWTARVSTAMWGHSLAEVLPTLITDGAPAFGRDTNGPQLTRVPLIPEGHVIVGTPVPVSTAAPAATVAPR